MQRSREWKLQNQETNTINKAFQLSHFFTHIPFTKSISVSEVSVGQQTFFFFLKTAQRVREDFKTIHLRMKAWHGSLF